MVGLPRSPVPVQKMSGSAEPVAQGQEAAEEDVFKDAQRGPEPGSPETQGLSPDNRRRSSIKRQRINYRDGKRSKKSRDSFTSQPQDSGDSEEQEQPPKEDPYTKLAGMIANLGAKMDRKLDVENESNNQ